VIMSARAVSGVTDVDAGRSLMDQAVSRAAGAERVEGNCVRLLRDAAENYPAWLAAIAAAERYVCFEAYIMRDDASGRQFAEALIAKAREGVSVRLLYDWMGAFGKTPSRFWDAMSAAGVEVRCFNPFTPASPLGWVHRDHRKSIVVDGSVGFVTGLCVGDAWVGDPERDIAPWRDTGVEVRGPAVAEIERAFGAVWAVVGPAIPQGEFGAQGTPAVAGEMAVRIVASEPWRGKMLRLDELVAGAARETLWLTDAYYAGMPSHVQALRAAALDGVDVRLLVPGGSDIPLLRPLSQAGYRPLLEAGVRVFEWNGPMLHAKTAVADGRLARVGSSNLNIASWLGNYELDAVVEDIGFAEEMAQQYAEDLTKATEVVLHSSRRSRRGHRGVHAVHSAEEVAPQNALHDGKRSEKSARGTADAGGAVHKARTHRRRRGSGSAGRGVAGAIRLGNTVTAAVTDHRVLATSDARAVAVAGAILVGFAAVAVYWPKAFAIPFALLAAWFGAALLLRAFRLRVRVPERKSVHPTPLGERTDGAAEQPVPVHGESVKRRV
jgi:cardiolipin synthase A/B